MRIDVVALSSKPHFDFNHETCKVEGITFGNVDFLVNTSQRSVKVANDSKVKVQLDEQSIQIILAIATAYERGYVYGALMYC